MIENILNSNSVKQLKKLIDEADKIVLVCHVRPDGDAIGSTLGLAHLLRSRGKHVWVVPPDLPPKTLSFLPGFKDIVAHSKYPEFSTRLINEADLIICCDFNKLSRLDHLAPVVENAPAKKVLIDHHQQPDDFTDVMFSFPEMSSTCELVFRIIAALGLYTEMGRDSAICITTGLITDTRNFSVNCPNPEIYLILVDLLKKGVDKGMIVREALETKSLDSFRLRAYALSDKLELFERNRAALITLSEDELKRFNYERGDSEGLVNEPLQIKGITYSFFLREDSDCIKVSARSVRNFPVSQICEDLFGGGGHLQAAGAEFHGSLEECRKILVEALPNYDKYLNQRKETDDKK